MSITASRTLPNPGENDIGIVKGGIAGRTVLQRVYIPFAEVRVRRHRGGIRRRRGYDGIEEGYKAIAAAPRILRDELDVVLLETEN